MGISQPNVDNTNPSLEDTKWSIPLKDDLVPLEDVESREKELISSTLVGKIISIKILN